MAEPVFSLKNVGYSYPGDIVAIKDLTLDINKGERAAIIGANGTGKSTLLTLLDALIFPNTGSITAFNKEITEHAMRDAETQRDFRKRVGFVFQNPDVQLFCPTVREDIVFGPLQLGVDHDEIRKRLEWYCGKDKDFPPARPLAAPAFHRRKKESGNRVGAHHGARGAAFGRTHCRA